MKRILTVLTGCLLTAYTCFSQDTSQDSSVWKRDTLYSVSAAQLRVTCKIFTEHRFFKSENEILKENILLLNRSGLAKDIIIQSNQAQINALNDIIYRKDMIISNNDEAITGMERNITELGRRNWKYLGVGAFAGLVIYGACTVIF